MKKREASTADGLFVEPNVLIAIAIEEAIYEDGHAFDVRMPTRRTVRIEDDRPDGVFIACVQSAILSAAGAPDRLPSIDLR